MFHNASLWSRCKVQLQELGKKGQVEKGGSKVQGKEIKHPPWNQDLFDLNKTASVKGQKNGRGVRRENSGRLRA